MDRNPGWPPKKHAWSARIEHTLTLNVCWMCNPLNPALSYREVADLALKTLRHLASKHLPMFNSKISDAINLTASFHWHLHHVFKPATPLPAGANLPCNCISTNLYCSPVPAMYCSSQRRGDQACSAGICTSLNTPCSRSPHADPALNRATALFLWRASAPRLPTLSFEP